MENEGTGIDPFTKNVLEIDAEQPLLEVVLRVTL
jgi:hypothetical protein